MKGAKLQKIILDVLKPHEPILPEMANKLASVKGVKDVIISLVELDKDTESLKVTLEGEMDYDDIASEIGKNGGVIHSIDEVVVRAKR